MTQRVRASIALALFVFVPGVNVAAELAAVRLDEHAGRVWDVAMSPDGRYAASICEDSLVEHRDGSTTSQGVLRVWDTSRCKLIVSTPMDDSQLLAIKFMPDGERLAVAGWKGLYLVQARDGRVLRTFSSAKTPIHAIAVSRDGSMLASVALETVQIWNIHTGETLKTGTHEFGFKRSIELTRDGRLLFAGSEKSHAAAERSYFVRLWDVGREARDLRFGFPAPTESYRDIAISSDERRVLTLNASWRIEEWDVQSARRIREWAEPRAMKLIAVSGHARTLATVSHEGHVTLWDIATGSPLSTCRISTRSCESLAVSDDGQHAVAGTVEKDVWLLSQSGNAPAAAPSERRSTPAVNRAPATLFPINPLPR